MDFTQIVVMAKECGCFKVGEKGELIICNKCANAVPSNTSDILDKYEVAE